MIIRTLSILVTIVTASSVVAEQEVYGSTSGCQFYYGDDPVEGMVMTNLRNSLRWKSVCGLSKISVVGGGSTIVTYTCSGNAMSWSETRTFQPTDSGNNYLVLSDLSTNQIGEITLDNADEEGQGS